jgi:FkbM family methyltransferase
MRIDCAELTLGSKPIHVNYRNSSIGDTGVLKQIFQDQDYRIDCWAQGRALFEYHERVSSTRTSLIVDAGANIGASSLYFLNTFQNAFVFSIEPEINNWHLLELNTLEYTNRLNFLGAVSSRDDDLEIYDPGHSDWGFRTREVSDGETGIGVTVKAISPATILSSPLFRDMTPLILKVDIEGGEQRLFEGPTDWARAFPLIIIELHDWMLPFAGTSRNLFRMLAAEDFDLVHRGENIFLFNRAILAP